LVSITKTSSVALLAGATLLLSFPAMATVNSWSSPPTTLSVAGQSAEDVVVVSSNGLAVAAWERNNGTDDIIQVSTSLNGGTWSTPAVDISPVLFNSGDVQLAVNSSNLFMAVWEGDVDASTSTDVIWFSTSSDGLSWSSPPLALSSSISGEDADDPQLTVGANGLITVVWEYNNGTDDIIQSRSTLDGITWTPVFDLTGSGEDAFDPRLAVTPAGVTLAFWETDDGQSWRIQSRSTSNGTSWTDIVGVSGVWAEEDAYNPQVTVNSNGLVLVVFELDSGSTSIIRSSFSSDGLIWSGGPISSIEGDSLGQQVTVNSSGLFTAVWVDEGTDDIIQSSSSMDGINWSPIKNLSAAGRDSQDPQLTVNSAGIFVVVWEGDKSEQDSDDVIWWSSSSDGVNWSVALPVYSSDDSLDADDPQVTADSTTGRVTAAWERDPDSNTDSDIIQASYITLAGGQGQGPATPSSTTTPTLAATGANVEWLVVAGLIAVIAGAGFLTVSRRKRTA
jgi:LPXTG-motif cell wall-anchored protein